MNPDFVSMSCIIDHLERSTTIQTCDGYVINRVEKRPYGNTLTYHATANNIDLAKEIIRLCASDFDDDLDLIFTHWEGGSLVLWSQDQTQSIVVLPSKLELKTEWKPIPDKPS